MVVLAVALLSGGCASTAAPSKDATPLTWVRYAAGDDLRASCSAGMPARVRMIHTVEGADRIRTFDVRETPEGAVVEARSILVADLARLSADAPVASPLLQKGPEATLSPAQFSALVETLKQAGLSGRAGGAAQPRATGSFWLVNGCHAGTWFIGLVRSQHRFDDVRLEN
jgi:hypothetical protein